MNTFRDKIAFKLKTANIAEQIIYANIIIYIITLLFRAFSTLMQWHENLFVSWFSLPATFDQFLSKPWTIVTYGFLHADFFHILFNLMLLYYIGNLFLDFFSKRDFLIFYFSGIIVGGIIYLTSYNVFPALLGSNAVLLGASAGVTAILVGLATKVPNFAIHFRFIGPVKLWYIAVAMIVIDLIQLPINNTGGHLAHLGGALIGFLLTNQANKGKNLNKLFAFLFKSKESTPLKTVFKNPNPQKKSTTTSIQQQKIDAILDKISKSGYEALTKEEKDFLFNIGKK
ncbi:rhomboid family intramembrane serine protease [Aureibaculum marinum]|uniref:Rhomboid family intramembrane serine protease n=1 Tax=Aureibaculum marinum TaxID=2487930 RepID=A0A3N4NXQ5_9FLAO|nr:rhomboid family intramembrane serine protease [Aureibaculum marinum]RPE00855.1 rhomboid family intramembrane serine protease [Aureibaculum marinum]